MSAAQRVVTEKLLHVDSTGAGPDVVLLHGWGMHSGYWQGLVNELKQDHRLHCIDLPGHGGSGYGGELAIEDFVNRIVRTIEPVTDKPFYLLGWSLGGVIAQRLTLDFPERIKRLMLIASSPCFVQRGAWRQATQAGVFAGFARSLLADYKQTLNRFVTLQVRGSAQAQRGLRELKAQLFSRGEPDQRALKAGLSLLQSVDLRHSLSAMDKPVMLIGGERDMLVPRAALPEFARLLRQAQVHIIKGAGHAPFLSHPAAVVKLIKAFCDD